MEPKPNYGQFPSRPRHTAPDVEIKAVASETEGNHTMHRSRAHTHTYEAQKVTDHFCSYGDDDDR